MSRPTYARGMSGIKRVVSMRARAIMSKPAIGAIVTAYNGLASTQECLPSIHNSSYKVPIVLIDNGSTDSTSTWAGSRVDVLVRNSDNIGVSAAWNQGIRFARAAGCDHFLIISNDVVLGRDTIGRMADVLLNRPQSGLVCARDIAQFGGATNPSQLAGWPIEPGTVRRRSFPCFMLSWEAYREVGKFDEEFSRRGKAYYEDDDYWHRLILSGFLPVMVRGALIYHYGGTMDEDSRTFGFARNLEYYREKWGGPPGEERDNPTGGYSE